MATMLDVSEAILAQQINGILDDCPVSIRTA